MLKRIVSLISVLLFMALVITYAGPAWPSDDALVVRFVGGGDLDTTFNPPTGFLTYNGGLDDYNYGVAIQSDGKIVVAGVIDNFTEYDVRVERLNTDGSRDAGFGTGSGLNFGTGSARDEFGWAVAIQSDGKIVVAGERGAAPAPPIGGGVGGGG